MKRPVFNIKELRGRARAYRGENTRYTNLKNGLIKLIQKENDSEEWTPIDPAFKIPKLENFKLDVVADGKEGTLEGDVLTFIGTTDATYDKATLTVTNPESLQENSFQIIDAETKEVLVDGLSLNETCDLEFDVQTLNLKPNDVKTFQVKALAESTYEQIHGREYLSNKFTVKCVEIPEPEVTSFEINATAEGQEDKGEFKTNVEFTGKKKVNLNSVKYILTNEDYINKTTFQLLKEVDGELVKVTDLDITENPDILENISFDINGGESITLRMTIDDVEGKQHLSVDECVITCLELPIPEMSEFSVVVSDEVEGGVKTDNKITFVGSRDIKFTDLLVGNYVNVDSIEPKTVELFDITNNKTIEGGFDATSPITVTEQVFKLAGGETVTYVLKATDLDGGAIESNEFSIECTEMPVPTMTKFALITTKDSEGTVDAEGNKITFIGTTELTTSSFNITIENPDSIVDNSLVLYNKNNDVIIESGLSKNTPVTFDGKAFNVIAGTSTSFFVRATDLEGNTIQSNDYTLESIKANTPVMSDVKFNFDSTNKNQTEKADGVEFKGNANIKFSEISFNVTNSENIKPNSLTIEDAKEGTPILTDGDVNSPSTFDEVNYDLKVGDSITLNISITDINNEVLTTEYIINCVDFEEIKLTNLTLNVTSDNPTGKTEGSKTTFIGDATVKFNEATFSLGENDNKYIKPNSLNISCADTHRNGLSTTSPVTFEEISIDIKQGNVVKVEVTFEDINDLVHTYEYVVECEVAPMIPPVVKDLSFEVTADVDVTPVDNVLTIEGAQTITLNTVNFTIDNKESVKPNSLEIMNGDVSLANGLSIDSPLTLTNQTLDIEVGETYELKVNVTNIEDTLVTSTNVFTIICTVVEVEP